MSGKDHTEEKSGERPPRTLWAYGYKILPFQTCAQERRSIGPDLPSGLPPIPLRR
jgi:hypothetical protein